MNVAADFPPTSNLTPSGLLKILILRYLDDSNVYCIRFGVTCKMNSSSECENQQNTRLCTSAPLWKCRSLTKVLEEECCVPASSFCSSRAPRAKSWLGALCEIFCRSCRSCGFRLRTFCGILQDLCRLVQDVASTNDRCRLKSDGKASRTAAVGGSPSIMKLVVKIE